MPVPAPTAPSGGGTADPADSAACCQAAATSPASTCIRRTSLRNESSHSATTGITTSSPMAGTASAMSWHAASYTRPTCMVEVRKTGVPMIPHSDMSRKPVHSPAPLRTAPPAGTGRARMSAAGSTTVTPVRATPRPAGGSGSSRHTVACPTPAPGTSRMERVGPDGRPPIWRPRSAMRGMPARMSRLPARVTGRVPVCRPAGRFSRPGRPAG